MRSWFALLVAPILLVSSKSLGEPAGSKYSHPGTIVDAYSRKGIVAEAYAYGSQNPNKGPGCPTYSDQLDSQKSSPSTGNFTFHIDDARSGYLATYCEPGYAPRTETANDNSTDGTRVQPDPVTLYPTSSDVGVPVNIATVAIRTDLEGLHANFTYYERSNPKAFSAAQEFSSFSDADRNVIRELLLEDEGFFGKSQFPSEQPKKEWVENPDVAFVAISKDLNRVRSDFVYYSQADEKAYFEALHQSFPRQAQSIEAIRKRREPFGKASR